MFGLENWDSPVLAYVADNWEGLMALLPTLMFVGWVAMEAWKTRHDGTWNDVFKLYGLVMGMIFVWIVCAIIAPFPTLILSGLLVFWSIATIENNV